MNQHDSYALPRIDFHCDTLTAYMAPPGSANDLYELPGHLDLRRLMESGGKLQDFAIFLSQKFSPDMDVLFEEFLRITEIFNDNLTRHADKIQLVTGLDTLDEIWESERLAALLSVEDGAMIDGRHERLEDLFDAGVRLLTLTWNYENSLAYPNSMDPDNMARGLKPFGREVIQHMNDMGMVVDVSHLSDGGFWDVLEVSQKPVLASHSNARAVTNHPRNMTDKMIKALAEQGGIMGMNFCPLFLSDNDPYMQAEDVVRHIKHIRNVGGIEVIALGSDYDGIRGELGMKDCTEFWKLAQGLEKANFTTTDIERIWYGNALRFLRDTLR